MLDCGGLTPNQAELIEALREVRDPEIGVSIVELGMVRNVDIQQGKVSVTVALTVPSCPLAGTIKADVEEAILKLKGVNSVDINTTYMTKEELSQLAAKIQARRGGEGYERSAQVSPGIDRLSKGGIRNIFAIVSGKGGVGKSFATSMLAVELRRLGYEVGILDADVTGPSIPKTFGLISKPMAGEKGILPVSTRLGIKVMSMNLIIDDPSAPTIWRGPIINSVIRQMYGDVEWGDLHFLLVDLPPGTSDAPLTVFQSLDLDGVIVVTTPQDLAFLVVSKAINMAKKLNVPILGLIENMSYFVCSKCREPHEVFGPSKGEEAASSSGIPFLGRLPMDPKISRLSDQGKIEDYQSSEFTEVAKKLRQIASEVVTQPVGLQPIAWMKEDVRI